MNFVLDASVTLAWCFGDEANETTTKILEMLKTGIAYVPELWTLEIGNILVSAERRRRISYAGIVEFVSLLGDLNIQIDKETSNKGFHEILALAHSENLTTYDAAYLELAMRLGLSLATKDNALQKAAKKLGVKMII